MRQKTFFNHQHKIVVDGIGILRLTQSGVGSTNISSTSFSLKGYGLLDKSLLVHNIKDRPPNNKIHGLGSPGRPFLRVHQSQYHLEIRKHQVKNAINTNIAIKPSYDRPKWPQDFIDKSGVKVDIFSLDNI